LDNLKELLRKFAVDNFVELVVVDMEFALGLVVDIGAADMIAVDNFLVVDARQCSVVLKLFAVVNARL